MSVYIDSGDLYCASWGLSGVTNSAYLRASVEANTAYIVSLTLDSVAYALT